MEWGRSMVDQADCMILLILVSRIGTQADLGRYRMLVVQSAYYMLY